MFANEPEIGSFLEPLEGVPWWVLAFLRFMGMKVSVVWEGNHTLPLKSKLVLEDKCEGEKEVLKEPYGEVPVVVGWRDKRGFRGGLVDKRVGRVGLVGFLVRFGDEESRGKYGCGGGFPFKPFISHITIFYIITITKVGLQSGRSHIARRESNADT